MKIIYVANHHQRSGNDDEGAITHALRVLGHEVLCFEERRPQKAVKERGVDFVLFHHWRTAYAYIHLFTAPKVMWYFDLVDAKDRSVAPRTQRRITLITETMKSVQAAFFTDGDWAAANTTKKAFHLSQGADERIVGKGTRSPGVPPLLFTGMRLGNGSGRVAFVEEMSTRYGDSFLHLTQDYREELRNYIASTEVVMCPSSPVTDRYWSNRVYNAAGFGGCILHPYSAGLAEHFEEHEVATYRNVEEMHTMIDFLLKNRPNRELLSENALARVQEEHLYRHRVEKMLSILKEQGIV